jgi:uncharacterized protein YkwD
MMPATRSRQLAVTLIGVAVIGACTASPGPSESRPPAEVTTPPAEVATPGPDAYAEQIVTATNAARTAQGLPALAVSACARDAALDRAAALVGDAELTHADLGPVHDACAPPSGMTAENLSRTAAAPDVVVDAWLASPGHANNLLSPELTAIGVGCVPDDGYEPGALLCAQIFLG